MAAPLPVDLNRVDPIDAWKSWQPTKQDWSRKWIAHLYRRAAFGATPAEIDRAIADGFPKTLERLFTGAPDASELLELFTETGQYCKEQSQLRAWWLSVMLGSGHPLREKLTLFWHNHFATSLAKVRNTSSMFEQNVTIRKHALGRFRPFLLDMSKNPAMLVWLDSNQNVKDAPNENYARELMELFSLGVGNYTEKDVRAAARAFTGWHTNSAPNEETFDYNPDEHDEGLKTLFGRNGNWNGEDVVRLCCDQPACARFLVGKVYAFLVSETPPPKGLLTPLEERFRKSDYDVADLVKTMLGSQLFFSSHAYRMRVKWPVEYAIEACRSLVPGRIGTSNLTEPLARMGQVLFAPPNVKGWRTGTDWLNSATLLARNNFAETVALGGEWVTPGSTGDPIIRLPIEGSTPILAYLFGISRQSETSSPTEADIDPIATLSAVEPKDLPSLVKRMGELLYGERINPAQAARIEKFLLEPLLAPKTSTKPLPLYGPRLVPVRGLPGSPSLPIPVPPAPTPALAPPPREVAVKPKPPGPPDLKSPEFKARVREALHAMMCLPEYQLN